MEQIKVEFLDAGREPKCKPDPRYPAGIDIDVSEGASLTCSVALPYPAPRCGAMLARCGKCDASVAVTVAGRSDDPRSVKLACKMPLQ
jgi:hypothetical protein